ncbi:MULTISPECIES: hypothetical protein [unclassified Mesorhizobium]|uniref:hypothetical protein n=1 Tax=unclassified Mesorhizobium TaxID=325217 RepID=UPI000FD9BD24|nr:MULTISPECIES: hypothetical protein [unclassified Mesorhizobium]TGQ09083.1 hypothetical protein EN862_022945 [Mesorhizobium sp. M2E.F.Ca.ET.219.01.1.1]TGT69618.1 hypothetical protein EN809_025225 [Mesorhizobium sp. M2E.F.Ca.ET.166.01.1.1]TGW01949.1 hypothetical protein EN797_016715 [Mesorhizobium sp. M2E.F.Ca.ET.154.01.1.1]
MKSPVQAIQLAGERRQVTALFYDVVGSTELMERSDPEEYGRFSPRFRKGHPASWRVPPDFQEASEVSWSKVRSELGYRHLVHLADVSKDGHWTAG